ncbi:hypothetical protein DFH07DRAFT_1056891 [Mycena maculata]|uniref:TPR-like protein n=1 Tax=Mycena maculata TaxID=230809 RepID=A0AAD7K0N1_9AGAR|nr:hypothetical protein DFH07DRAFT_1056891 [Mycena maculata]
MENEATLAGLRLRPRTSAKWSWEESRGDTGNPPSSALQRFLECFPIKHLSPMIRMHQLDKGRRISRGQRVHASVAFKAKEYCTVLGNGIEWGSFVGQNNEYIDFDWATRYVNDRLEMDLLDSSSIMEAIRNLNHLWTRGEHSDLESHWIRWLSFAALSGNLAATYLSASTPVWDDDPEVEVRGAVGFFQKLADQQPVIFSGDLAEVLEAQGRILHLRGKDDLERLSEDYEDALRIRRAVAGESPRTPSGRYKLAASLCWSASYAIVLHKFQKALHLFEESLDLLRSLLVEEFSPAFPLFAFLQCNFATCLKYISHDHDLDTASRVAEKNATLSRTLAQVYPQYTPLLAAALHDLAFGFPPGRSLQEPHAAEESIDLYRKLAKQNPDEHDKSFSDSLYNLSCRLFEAGQHEEATCASLEEMQIRRNSQEKGDLATCLDHLSRCLRAVGRLGEALNAAEESVRIRRDLAEANGSWQFESQLADSLSNLSCCLTLMGQSQHALYAAQEAVSIQRGLSRDIPAATFNPRLAVFLYNFSASLSAVGRHGEALRAAEEVIQIRATWGAESDRALSLSRLALCLEAVGKQDEALTVAEKCLDPTCKLALGEKSNSAGVEGQLAEALLALSFCFPAEQVSRALKAVADSVAIYRKLANRSPPAYKTALADALFQLSSLLSSCGQHKEAFQVAVETVQFSRALPKDRFADFLYHLSACSYSVGNSDEGTGPAQECVVLRRELAQEFGTWKCKEQLADALFNLSLFFSHGDASRALEAVQEAVTIQREISDHMPAHKFNQRLADGLQNLAARALLAGQYQEALGSIQEAVAITRKLVDLNPPLHTPSLINILYTYANILCEHVQYEEGYQVISETDGLRQTVCCDSIFTSVEASAAYMSTRARCIIGLGRHGDGLFCLLDAIKLYKGAFSASLPYESTFESFPWFLRNVHAAISALGQNNAEVLDATAEVVELSRSLAGNSSQRFDHCLDEVLELYSSTLSVTSTGCDGE